MKKNPVSKTFGIRLPFAMAKELETVAQSRGCDRNAVTREAIAQFLQGQKSKPPSF